jgi:hypothetical protein
MKWSSATTSMPPASIRAIPAAPSAACSKANPRGSRVRRTSRAMPASSSM